MAPKRPKFGTKPTYSYVIRYTGPDPHALSRKALMAFVSSSASKMPSWFKIRLGTDNICLQVVTSKFGPDVWPDSIHQLSRHARWRLNSPQPIYLVSTKPANRVRLGELNIVRCTS